MKQSKVCHDVLDVAFEISKLIRFSRKRSAALDKIKVENQSNLEESGLKTTKIRSFCPTRWTVRVLESIISNYNSLNQLWEECLESSSSLDPDVKARIIGVYAQRQEFHILFGLHLSQPAEDTVNDRQPQSYAA